VFFSLYVDGNHLAVMASRDSNYVTVLNGAAHRIVIAVSCPRMAASSEAAQAKQKPGPPAKSASNNGALLRDRP